MSVSGTGGLKAQYRFEMVNWQPKDKRPLSPHINYQSSKLGLQQWVDNATSYSVRADI